MAYFNPQKVDFNPSTNMIDAVGAVGKSLYEIYKDNVAKNQNQAKIDENIRHNKSVEQHNADVLGETKQQHAWQREDSDKKFNADQEWKNKEFNFGLHKFNAEQDFKNKSLAQTAQYHNLMAQKAAEDRAFNQWYKMQSLAERQEKAAAEAAKEEAELNANPLKNVPVAIQNRINNAKTALNRYATYSQGLVDNESQISGFFDNLTAPVAKYFGLNSDKLASSYADAEAIAELERANTKGGSNQVKIDTYNAIQPVNMQFNKTMANIASRASNHLTIYDETIKELAAQGNYRAVEALQAERDELVNSLPKEIKQFVKVGLPKTPQEQQKSLEQKFIQKQQNLKPQNKRQSDYYEQADEHGGVYLN